MFSSAPKTTNLKAIITQRRTDILTTVKVSDHASTTANKISDLAAQQPSVPRYKPDGAGVTLIFHTEKGEFVLGGIRSNPALEKNLTKQGTPFPPQISSTIGGYLANPDAMLREAVTNNIKIKMFLNSEEKEIQAIQAQQILKRLCVVIEKNSGWEDKVCVHTDKWTNQDKSEGTMCYFTTIKHIKCDYSDLETINEALQTIMKVKKTAGVNLKTLTEFKFVPLKHLINNSLVSHMDSELTKAEKTFEQYGNEIALTFNDLAVANLIKNGAFQHTQFAELKIIKQDSVVSSDSQKSILLGLTESKVENKPFKLIRLDPQCVPKTYQKENHQELDMIPDGTGLQILFKVDEQYYLIAGARSGSVLTVNGGTIENKEATFFLQLAEELDEETFGVMKIVHDKEGYHLLLKGHGKHLLSILEEQTVLNNKVGKYAYVTFTAVCSSVTLEQLNQTAALMSPTANFWNKIGNYLYNHFRKAPKDDRFSDYWQSQYSERCKLIEELISNYDKPVLTGQLLIDPLEVFNSKNINDALNNLHKVETYKEFDTLFRHTVGRYSERPAYHVFRALDLLSVVQDSKDVVNDVNGVKVANGIFNSDAVVSVFPSLKTIVKKPASITVLQGQLSERGLFGAASVLNVVLPIDAVDPKERAASINLIQ